MITIEKQNTLYVTRFTLQQKFEIKIKLDTILKQNTLKTFIHNY